MFSVIFLYTSYLYGWTLYNMNAYASNNKQVVTFLGVSEALFNNK